MNTSTQPNNPPAPDGDPMADYEEREAAFRKEHNLPPEAIVFTDRLYTKEEQRASVLWTLEQQRKERAEIEKTVPDALAAMTRLVAACAHKTGQSYHLRSMLYSLWNGRATRLVEIVNLDRELRDALLTVMRVFGCDSFFYDEISGAFKKARLFEWFLEEGGDERQVAA